MNYRMPTGKLVIGAYILQPYAQTEQHIKELAECGIELIVCLAPKDRTVLDLLEKYGVGCILSGIFPPWWGGNGSKAGQMHQINDFLRYQKALEEFSDHPAVWGIDIGDEPSALDFEYLNSIAQLLNASPFELVPYLNLYPNYAAVSQNSDGEALNQLGTASYAEYIERYVQEVDLPYLSYDFYLYPQTKNHNVAKMMENFRIVSDACRKSGKDFWYIPQVNDRRPDAEPPSLNMLRYQSYIALCFGATVINWACYTGGWWFHNVLDLQGNKTEQYEKLKSMNRELRIIGERYMQYRTVSTHLVGFEEEIASLGLAELKSLDRFNCGFAKDLSTDTAKLVIVQMVHRSDSGRYGLFLCNASDPCDEHPSTASISFASTGRTVSIYSGDAPVLLSKNGDRYSFELPSGAGVLITFD